MHTKFEVSIINEFSAKKINNEKLTDRLTKETDGRKNCWTARQCFYACTSLTLLWDRENKEIYEMTLRTKEKSMQIHEFVVQNVRLSNRKKVKQTVQNSPSCQSVFE